MLAAVLAVVGLVGGMQELSSLRTQELAQTVSGYLAHVGRNFDDPSYALPTGGGVATSGVLLPSGTATRPGGPFARDATGQPTTARSAARRPAGASQAGPASGSSSAGQPGSTSPSGASRPASSAPPSPSSPPSSSSSSSPASPGPSQPPWTPPAASSVNLLAGGTVYGDPTSQAARVAASGGPSAAAAAVLADVPQARWIAPTDGLSNLNDYLSGARLVGRVPVLVVYGVPGRDCGGFSAGGAANAAAYLAWVTQVRSVISGRDVVVVVEPDALAHGGCTTGSAALGELLGTIGSAVDVLTSDATTSVYIDAGHEDWLTAADAASRLRAAHVDRARGFSLNVSNFYATSTEVAFGQQVSAQLGGSHFVVDTSRNGAGPTAGLEWCNPAGRLAGAAPGGVTGTDGLDGYLWVKNPGESDGSCLGGPSSGQWFDSWAADFVSRSQAAGRL